ncbi:MAG: DegT/DnrJ/EryC1/StrS family aminotransferase [Chlamydiae bacterium]|nr:DegT/DnrJ/EryC1/StrS family aminotransferase [Chlamydiota bacterium]
MIVATKPMIGDEEIEAVTKVLRSGILSQGPEVAAFENEFSSYVNGFPCVAVNSATSGLHIALLAAGIKPADEVIVPSFTFAATANSVALIGAKPVFVDIDPKTFNIDPQKIHAALTPKTRAIQVVHLFGLPAEINTILDIAKTYNLLVFEDAAQAHLAKFQDQYVGTFGTASTFSFYPSKNMTSGEGGIISCSTLALARECKLLRNQGMEKRYENEIVGFNCRMTDIHASIGRAQLKKIEKWTQQRIENAHFYHQHLRGVIKPYAPLGSTHVYHQYTIRVPGHNRDHFAKEMLKNGVECNVFYPKPVHRLPAYQLNLDLPETEAACKEVLSIPVHPSLSQLDLEKVVEVVNKLSNSGA